jgi:hypothetical protein
MKREAGPALATGRYRDTLGNARRSRGRTSAWHSNLIAASLWPLVASLLKNDPKARGILYCAFGEGDPRWDTAPVAPTPQTTRLRAEVGRVDVPPGDIRFIDATGRTANVPTHRLGLEATFTAQGAGRQLREFALFGGSATAVADSGEMINYVIHRRMDLAAGQTLRREIRLSFRPTGGATEIDWVTLPSHWLARHPVSDVDGIGKASAEALARSGIKTIKDLAVAEPSVRIGTLAAARVVEMRAKARLALQCASQVRLIAGLAERTVAELLAAPPDTLAQEARTPVSVVERLREQLGILQLALDAKVLRHLDLKTLAAPAGD